jgi:hypothetical protein
VLTTNDTEWTRDALIRDPQGAEFTASQFTPPGSKAVRGRRHIAAVQPDDDRVASLVDMQQTERDRIERARADYKSELIDGGLYAEIRDEAEAEIARLDAERLAMTAGSAASSILLAPSPVAAFEDADLAARRATIDLLCEVCLFLAPRGRKTFDPETVRIIPKQ